MRIENTFHIKIVISIFALGIFAVRLAFPSLKIDSIALGILVLAVLPWLTFLIDSAKLPGGWEIKIS